MMTPSVRNRPPPAQNATPISTQGQHINALHTSNERTLHICEPHFDFVVNLEYVV